MEIPAIERTRLFLFHKPAGVVTTNRDPEGRKTVFDVLPADLPRLMTIGRLDINTEGLLLLTNDGGLSRVLELPATGWLRRYRARVHGKVEEKALAGLKDGIAVDGVFYGSIEATLDREQGSNAWLTIGLREGKNREVKNILGALGLEVSRLIRISYGPFQLGDLPEGHVQEIKGRLLRDQLGERLIEESGANFEAPVVNQFSNQPVKRAPEPRAEAVEGQRVQREGERGRIGEGGLIKKRQRRENSRDEALGKLSTRPDRPKLSAGFGDRASEIRTGRKAGARRQIRRQAQSAASSGPRPGRNSWRKNRNASSGRSNRPDSASRTSGWLRAHGLSVPAGPLRKRPRWRPSGPRRRPMASRAEGREFWQGAGRASARRWPKGRSARRRKRRSAGKRCGSSAVSFAAGRLPRRAASRSARPPTAHARRCSTCSRIAFRKNSKARACSTFSPAPARWGWRRCRAARRTACSSRNWPKGAA